MNEDRDFFAMSVIALLISIVLLASQCQHDACIDNCSTRKFASADEARVCFVSCRQSR
jgi:hypothetical protein